MEILSAFVIIAVIILAGVAISIGLYKYCRKKDRKQRRGNNEGSLTCKFVVDGKGSKIGESIAINKDLLIIKSGKKYLGVPLKHIKKQKNKLQVRGLISREKAEKLGERWLKHSNRGKNKEKRAKVAKEE